LKSISYLVHDDTACLEVATLPGPLPGPLQLSFIINRIEDTAKYICFKNGKMAAACSTSDMQLLVSVCFPLCPRPQAPM
jgi:hypothetical protein